MRAFKVLIDGRSGYTGWRWPLPDGETPGEWVHATASEPLELCVNGVHACTVGQLAQWLGEELWRIELGGEILETDAALVAARGRLLGQVPGWDQTARKAFAADCAGRARQLVAGWAAGEPLLASVERFAAGGRVGPASYWTALIAGERAAGRRDGPEYDAAFARERAAQAQWLQAELGSLEP